MVPKDELYANLRWQPEGTYHVLATAYDEHSLYNGRSPQPIPGAGIHQPILWTTEYGKGRVFITTLGHGPEEARGLAFEVTFARGAEWAATRKVTLPIPPEMAAPEMAVLPARERAMPAAEMRLETEALVMAGRETPARHKGVPAAGCQAADRPKG